MKHTMCLSYRPWIILLLAFVLTIPAAPLIYAEEPVLKELAQQRGIRIRSAVAEGAVMEDEVFGTAVRTQFHGVSPELSLLFGNVHPEPDTYAFDLTDRLVDMAQATGLEVHGHTLVWHSNLPEWLTSGEWTREEAMAILEDHIKTVVGRYKGRIRSWDVINEAVNIFGNLRNTFWMQTIGSDYLFLAFLWAREADPDALLYYKDFSVAGEKAVTIYELIKWFQEYNIPVHGVNIQVHAWLNLDIESLLSNIAASMNLIGGLGVDVNIVEVEVPIDIPVTTEKLVQQADVYRRLLQLCLCSPTCSDFEFFGFTDKYSWIPLLFPGWDAALLADEDFIPKPAFTAVAETLGQFNDTDNDGIANDAGTCSYLTNPCRSGSATKCFDNCPDLPNVDQADRDGDGIGNLCDRGPVDLDADGQVTLADAILALQVMAGKQPAALRGDYLTSGADLDGNDRIDLVEALMVLRQAGDAQ